MSNLTILGDTSGSVVLQAPAVSGSTTINLPAASGTAMVSGNMPAFSASQSANQSISTATNTKIQFNTEDFDTNSCYDNTTNYRFTPNVAGYYQINAQLRDASGAATGSLQCLLYKNGSTYKQSLILNGGNGHTTNLSCIVYFNGTTDYVEIYASQNSGVSMNVGSGTLTYFNGSMVRSA